MPWSCDLLLTLVEPTCYFSLPLLRCVHHYCALTLPAYLHGKQQALPCGWHSVPLHPASADEDKGRVGLTGGRKGVLSRVAGRLSLTSSEAKHDSDASLSDQWLEFLAQQVEAADAAEAASKTRAGSQSPTLLVKSQPQHKIQEPVHHDWNSMQAPPCQY